MLYVLLISRLVLAAALAVAGVAKLADLAGSRRALEEFGVPDRLAGPLGTILPLAEIAVAAALIPLESAWWGALAALGLLGVFTAGIAGTLLSGRRPDCHCFGQLYSAPIGWKTLARNGVLIALAALVLWQGRPGASIAIVWSGLPAGSSWLAAVLAVALVVLGVVSWLLVELIRQQGRILLRLDALEARSGAPDGAAAAPSAGGLAVGQPAPAFTLPGLYGETLTLDSLRARGKPLLLAFSDPNCGPCATLMPELGRWQREHDGAATFVVISRGKPEENRAKLSAQGPSLILLQKNREVFQDYDFAGTPSAVLLRPDGTIGSPLAVGPDQIRALVGRLAPPVAPTRGNGADAPAAATVGDLVPSMKLPDLAGRSVDLAGFRGRKTMLLFWNPDCGFCQQMLADVKALESRANGKGPRLVLVSTGTVERNRSGGFSSLVLLDQAFAAGRTLGVTGTPSAVLVDGDGKIASSVAVGAPAVLELANGVQTQVH
jgi:peroxiredoxin